MSSCVWTFWTLPSTRTSFFLKMPRMTMALRTLPTNMFFTVSVTFFSVPFSQIRKGIWTAFFFCRASLILTASCRLRTLPFPKLQFWTKWRRTTRKLPWTRKWACPLKILLSFLIISSTSMIWRTSRFTVVPWKVTLISYTRPLSFLVKSSMSFSWQFVRTLIFSYKPSY